MASVHIAGPALANLLTSAVSGCLDCDGVLLGTVHSRPVEVYSDETHGRGMSPAVRALGRAQQRITCMEHAHMRRAPGLASSGSFAWH